MRILVTGTEGQLVRSLVERGAALPGLSIATLGRPVLDLSDHDSIRTAMSAASFDVVVSAAAWTAVDLAETEQQAARAVNATGAGVVAAEAARRGAPVIHLSTDYVFSGESSRAWREDDPTSPLSVYGQTKLDGEQAVLAANDRSVIVRTAWVYGPFGKNFLKTMLTVAKSRDELGVVADQTGAPTCSLDIADGILRIAGNIAAAPAGAPGFGVFHLAARTDGAPVSWADFAQEIFQASAARSGPTAKVRRLTTADYPTPARRPRNSLLDCTRLADVHGVILPDWKTPIPTVVERVLTNPA